MSSDQARIWKDTDKVHFKVLI